MCDMKKLFDYNKKDQLLYEKQYLFIKGFAMGRNYVNTLKSLPVARKLHDGQYRKGTTIVDGEKVRLPYLCHPLKVCSTLISLNLPLSDEELDVLYSVAILHDTIEDGQFNEDDTELMTEYQVSPQIYRVIRSLSKQKGLSAEELSVYYTAIQQDKICLLVKMADRSHNVEDLYNIPNIPKYVQETRNYIYPMAAYAKLHWPELSNGVTILKSKIVSLTESTEALIEIYEERLRTAKQQLKQE